MADELIKLKNNDDVKAVVFRVNSPGGSAYISEQIWRQVVELKKVKTCGRFHGQRSCLGRLLYLMRR